MNKILNTKQAIRISKKLRDGDKSIVLCGGCFDILHSGHIDFLEKAKKQGDVLMILLESDETIQQMKGAHRPINTHKERAKILSALSCVDYVVMLPRLTKNDHYDELVISLKPAIIAITKGDPNKSHKVRQAKKISAHVRVVARKIENQSTTRLIQLLSKQNI